MTISVANSLFEIQLDMFAIKRAAQYKPTFLEGEQYVKLKKVNLHKIRKIKVKNEKKFFETKEKTATTVRFRNEMCKVLTEHVEELTGSPYPFRKKSFYTKTNDKGETEAVVKDSDRSRLNFIFDRVFDICNGSIVSSKKILIMMVDDWSAWNKATIDNLIGFLEALSSKGLGVYFMKTNNALRGVKDGPAVLNQQKRLEANQKQKGYFA